VERAIWLRKSPVATRGAFALDQSLPQEKLVVLRKCIEKILINRPRGEIWLTIRMVPVANMRAVEEIKASL